MADNYAVNPVVAGGATFASDDISSVHYPRIKLVFGADGVNSGDVAAANPLPVSTELPDAAALADGAANPTTPTVGAAKLVWNGATWDRAKQVAAAMDTAGTGVPAAGVLGQCDDAATAAVTENQFAPVRISTRRALLVEGVASGTPVIVSQATAANLNAQMAGDVAHDSADSGNPAKIGGKAAVAALPTAVANNDRANLITDRFGKLLVGKYDLGLIKRFAATQTTQQTGSTLITPTSGKTIVILSYSISVYGTTSGRVTLWFGASADTTYSEGTDHALADFEFVPGATPSAAPGTNAAECEEPADAADRYLKLTTSAAVSVHVRGTYVEVTA